jgi:REP element-mobilizing transposase RayT
MQKLIYLQHLFWYADAIMPRSARIDASGVLHHVIGRGIERRKIFLNDADCTDFLTRLASLTQCGALDVYGWSLMPNHFHLLCKTRLQPLSISMHRLLTGYAVNFNKRRRRHGHLFQNRFKSIVCQEDRYFKELVRYIHLNPLRSGLVESLAALDDYPYCGHSAILGRVRRPWQDIGYVLGGFGESTSQARRAYGRFMSAGVGTGRMPKLVGGGLVRSQGGWSGVLALRRRSAPAACDQRILGDSDFVRSVIDRMDERQRRNLRLLTARPEIDRICRQVCDREGVLPGELCSGSRRRTVVAARYAVAWIAVKEIGYSGAEVARHLGVSNSCITRSLTSGRRPDVDPLLERLHVPSSPRV